MKKTPFSCLVFIMITLVFVEASDQKNGFTLKAAGGFGKPFSGDLDSVLDSYEALFDGLAGRLGLQREGRIEKPAGMGAFGAELSWQYSKKLGIGLAVRYMQSKKTDLTTLLSDPLYKSSLQFSRDIRAIPVELTLTYRLMSSSRWDVYGLGGIHYCFASFSYSMKLEEEIWGYSTWSQSEGKVTGSNFGVHGGLGISCSLTRGLGVFLEVTGRSTGLNRWQGEESYSDYEKSSETRKGVLWRLDYPDTESARDYATLRLADKKPEGPNLENVRLFKNNLGGVFVSAGLIIAF